ncbi:major facilitator superfamily transporter multidrug resistance [Ascosphaera apis ARSEF 7405]|uniref:Major facilitator superfamily transporter multidrug resistance n=1 Tax=Ascosphaera apis ARSEF 7405 TaxID=392613 RepID=A0A167YXK3_9EURO|nr:major facilitator superfamily transporter multidrug resistance [Ascosphaera apis ARSEF 7405]
MRVRLQRSVQSPWAQFSILIFCRVFEPIAFTSVIPYLFFYIKSLDPSLDDASATNYVAITISVFALAQFVTSLFWGLMADKYGRKGIFLFGQAGVMMSMFFLSFCSNIWSVIFFRALGGLLSGNVVVLRTVIGDLFPDTYSQSRAISLNSIVYQIGYVVGPMIGGYLVEPCGRHPDVCKAMPLFKKYPYAPPSLVIAGLLACSIMIALPLLRETMPPKRTVPVDTEDANEEAPLLPEREEAAASRKIPMNIIHISIAYCILGFHTICFDQILPVFLASQTSDEPARLPFWFTGGLQMNASDVGFFISMSGILGIATMILIFPPVNDLLGSLRALRMNLWLFPISYIILPYLSLLRGPSTYAKIGVTFVIALKTVASSFAFNDIPILLNEATPSNDLLGYVNGIGQTAVSSARAVGPVIMGLATSFGQNIGIGGLGWFMLAFVAAVGVFQGYYISDPEQHIDIYDEEYAREGR